MAKGWNGQVSHRDDSETGNGIRNLQEWNGEENSVSRRNGRTGFRDEMFWKKFCGCGRQAKVMEETGLGRR